MDVDHAEVDGHVHKEAVLGRVHHGLGERVTEQLHWPGVVLIRGLCMVEKNEEQRLFLSKNMMTIFFHAFFKWCQSE